MRLKEAKKKAEQERKAAKKAAGDFEFSARAHAWSDGFFGADSRRCKRVVHWAQLARIQVTSSFPLRL